MPKGGDHETVSPEDEEQHTCRYCDGDATESVGVGDRIVWVCDAAYCREALEEDEEDAANELVELLEPT